MSGSNIGNERRKELKQTAATRVNRASEQGAARCIRSTTSAYWQAQMM